MNRMPSLRLAVLVAALIAVPAWAAEAGRAAQDQSGAAPTTEQKDETRVLDVLVVTGATQSDDKRWASDHDVQVPEIADTDWVPAAPAN
jgi:hypothetical protein